MNKPYGVLMGMALVLLITGAALASTNNTSTSSMTEIHVFDKNSTVKPSPVLSYSPMAINTTAVSWSNMTVAFGKVISRDWLSDIATVMAILTAVIALCKWRKTKKQVIKKMREERENFVKSSIIKINHEFQPVTLCSTNKYDFTLNGYTVSLKTGESLIIAQPLPDPDYFKYLMIAGWGFAKKDRVFSWKNVPGNDSERLLQYLKDDHNIEWAENAEIREFHNGMSICISNDTNTAEIMMDENKEKAILKITDNPIHNLKVKTENGELNIYEDGKPLADINSQEELGKISFFNSDQLMAGEPIKIVQPGWTGYTKHINFLDANPDINYGGDPSIEEIREKGIVGKVKSRYTNIHTHWIDLNIYVNILEIPKGAKHIKISLTKPNRTYISLNIAEIIPVTKKECGKIKKALEKEIQSETIKTDEVKELLELYQRLRNTQKPTDDDKGKLWSRADEYTEKKDIYKAYKLIKYALFLENNLEGRNKEILEKLMSTLKEKAEKRDLENETYFKDAVQSCIMLSHLYGVKAKFDYPDEAKWKKKDVECLKKAGDMIEEKSKQNEDKKLYEALMNLQWRCYVSATKKYEEMSNLQKAMEIRVKLNEVFERITERHPFSSPIIDNVFENFNEETNLTEKCWDVSLRDK